MIADDTSRMAINLSRNRDCAVFPCRLLIVNGRAMKVPARPEREGGRGFHDATEDPNQIAWLWRRWPGDLIAVRTGPPSNVALLDIDQQHDEARAWCHENRHRLRATRTFRSYSGGLHLHYRNTLGIKNATGKPVNGVDVRGDGGYLIYWFAYGLPCLDHSPLAPWPDWLTPVIWPPKPKPTPAQVRAFDAHPDKAIDRALDRIARSPSGTRNGELNRGAFIIGLRVAKGQMSRSAAEARLEAAALVAGMNHKADGILRTIKSGLEAAL